MYKHIDFCIYMTIFQTKYKLVLKRTVDLVSKTVYSRVSNILS